MGRGLTHHTPPMHNTSTLVDRAAVATPPALATRMRGLSDRAVAWLFIGPTMALLLAINIFPLIWTLKLSFTNFRANRPNASVLGVGIDNYVAVLTDPDIWIAMQATAHFLFWTIVLQTLIGFALAYLIDRKFRGHGFWTTMILIPMMLSPAVVGNFWAFLYQPQTGLFNYAVSFFTGIEPSSFEMIGSVKLAPWAIVIVDTWMWTPYADRGRRLDAIHPRHLDVHEDEIVMESRYFSRTPVPGSRGSRHARTASGCATASCAPP